MAVPHEAGGNLWVESSNGSVVIRGSDAEDVRVRARLRSGDLDRLDAMRVFAERDAEGLRIGVDWPGGERQRNEGCDFTILIPDAAAVVVRTSNDEISLEWVGESADLVTSNDNIVVRGVTGSVRAVTSNDGVRVYGSRGPVEIRTSNDGVRVEMAPSGEGPIDVVTSNDDVEIVVGPGFGGTLRASTSNGRVRVTGDGFRGAGDTGRSATLEFDLPGEASRVITSNGNVRVRVAG